MSALIFVKAEKLSALISFMHEKWVGLNILGLSALIFLALVTSPWKIGDFIFMYFKKYIYLYQNFSQT